MLSRIVSYLAGKHYSNSLSKFGIERAKNDLNSSVITNVPFLN